MTNLVEQRVEEIENQFNTETKAEIDAILEDIEELRGVIPGNIHFCIIEADLQ